MEENGIRHKILMIDKIHLIVRFFKTQHVCIGQCTKGKYVSELIYIYKNPFTNIIFTIYLGFEQATYLRGDHLYLNFIDPENNHEIMRI